MSAGKLTPQLHAAIVARVLEGAAPSVAARAEGISLRTWQRWMVHAADPDEPEDYWRYRDLAAAVDQADASLEIETVKAIRADDATRSLQWHAERRWRDRYGAELKIQIRDQVQDDLLARLRESLDAGTYRRVLAALVGDEGGEGAGADQTGDGLH